MLTGETERPLSDFLPRVLAHIDGVDVDMAGAFLVDAAIQFSKDTKLLSEVVCVGLEDCTTSYRLPFRNRPTEILSVRVFRDDVLIAPQYFHYRVELGGGSAVLYIQSAPDCGCWRVEVEALIQPTRDSDTLPAVLYEDWIEALSALTLARLYLLTDNQWYNPQAAANQMNIYDSHRRQALVRRITRNRPLQVRLANMRRL